MASLNAVSKCCAASNIPSINYVVSCDMQNKLLKGGKCIFPHFQDFVTPKDLRVNNQLPFHITQCCLLTKKSYNHANGMEWKAMEILKELTKSVRMRIKRAVTKHHM